MKKTRIAALVSFVFFAVAGQAWGEGFALYEYGARGMALGGATMARKADASAVAGNPALITQLKGSHVQAGATLIMPSGAVSTIDPDSGVERTSGLRTSHWFVPNMYYTQQVSDNWYLGVGEFSRFGLGLEFPHGWPGRFNMYQVNVQSMSINPVVAWKATNGLSLAAGIEAQYITLDVRKKTMVDFRPFGLPVYSEYDNSNSPQIDASIRNADSVAPGFNLAAHYQFNEQWAAGFQYRSQVQHRASGKNHLNVDNLDVGALPPPLSAALAPYDKQTYKAHGTVVVPDSYALGISWTPRKDLSFEAGAIYTRWSTFRSLRIHTDFPPGVESVAESKKKWNDVWRLNFGAEYQMLDWLTLRAGYAYDQSPKGRKYQDYLVPTNDRHIYSLGVGFNLMKDLNLDLAYALILPTKRTYRYSPDDGVSPGDEVLDGKSRTSKTHLFAISLSYAF